MFVVAFFNPIHLLSNVKSILQLAIRTEGVGIHCTVFFLILPIRVSFYRNKKTEILSIYSEFSITNISIPNNFIILSKRVIFYFFLKNCFTLMCILKLDYFQSTFIFTHTYIYLIVAGLF